MLQRLPINFRVEPFANNAKTFLERIHPMPRMRILNDIEKERFDNPPDFNAAQRKHYFDFPVALQK